MILITFDKLKKKEIMKKIVFGLLMLVGFYANAQIPSYVPTNGLVGYWPFNGNANDVSLSLNNGTVNGASLTSDRFGNLNRAYSFDGVDQFISVNPSNTILYNIGLTISLWVKITETVNQTSSFLVSKGNDVLNGHFHLAYDQRPLTISNGQSFQGDLNSLGIPIYSSPATPYPHTVWHHVVLTHDNQNMKIYVDGILTRTTVNTEIIGNLTSNILFGKHSNTSFNYYTKGLLDDVGIWNRALSQAEITALYTTLGISQIEAIKLISIYPNPAKDQITIDCGIISRVIGGSYKIVNTLGQEVSNGVMNSQQNVISLNTINSTGVYLVKIYDTENNLISTNKIIKQ